MKRLLSKRFIIFFCSFFAGKFECSQKILFYKYDSFFDMLFFRCKQIVPVECKQVFVAIGLCDKYYPIAKANLYWGR